MKKLILSVLTILLLVPGSFAQSFELYHNSEPFPSGGTVTVIDDVSVNLMLAHMSIKNISSGTKLVKAKKEEIYVVPNSMNTFCWVVCWANFIYVSPMGVEIGSGVTIDEFSGDYMPQENPGVTIMRYTFFDDANPNDSVHFFAEFNAGTVGIADPVSKTVSFSNPYPNPARSQVSFDYTLPVNSSNAHVKIHNLLGSVVKEVQLWDSSGKVTIDVSSLNEGFYFYSVTVDNEVLETKRLVISR
jgi:hypothetical protein